MNSYGRGDSQYFTPALFLEAKISISEEIEIYERIVFSFLDLTGQIGGIYELLEITAAFFVGYYNNILFNYELVNNIKTSECEKFNRKQVKRHKSLNETEDQNLNHFQTGIQLGTDKNMSIFDNNIKYSIKDL